MKRNKSSAPNFFFGVSDEFIPAGEKCENSTDQGFILDDGNSQKYEVTYIRHYFHYYLLIITIVELEIAEIGRGT